MHERTEKVHKNTKYILMRKKNHSQHWVGPSQFGICRDEIVGMKNLRMKMQGWNWGDGNTLLDRWLFYIFSETDMCSMHWLTTTWTFGFKMYEHSTCTSLKEINCIREVPCGILLQHLGSDQEKNEFVFFQRPPIFLRLYLHYKNKF